MIVSLINIDIPFMSELQTLFGEALCECRQREEALAKLPQADVIVTYGGGTHAVQLDDELLSVSKKLKLVCSLTAGVENLPLEKLHAMGVKVSNTKGAQGGSIAEYVIGHMIFFSHHYQAHMLNQQQHLWVPPAPGEDIDGQTLCIVGTGAIGKVIAQKAKGAGMRVIGVDKYPAPYEAFEQVYGLEALQKALGESDFVVMATPLTEETRYMIGEKEFHAMKNKAVFINISRGDTVDETALIRALEAKTIAGAILDVFHEEPLPKDSPLWAMKNVFITPHAAGPTINTIRNSARICYENTMRSRSGEPIVNEL